MYTARLSRFLVLLLALSAGSVFAEANCGVLPEKPQIADGATATYEELSASSQAVRTYITEVDAFLDCYDAYLATDEFKALPEAMQAMYANAMEEILEVRNDIGPEFNEQIQAYRAAHPE